MSSNEDFSVMIAASGRYDFHQDPSSSTSSPPSSTITNGGSHSSTTPHVIHAVNVTQPVQSWTVVRDHVDFMTMDVALSSAVSGLPSCPNHPAFESNHHHHRHSDNTDTIVQARNSAQEWLSAVLSVPAVRESPVMRHFLCYGANIVPPQFEDVAWINFTDSTSTIMGESHAPAAVASAAAVAQSPLASPTYAAVVASGSAARPNLDEMEMDDMFALDDEDDEDDDEHHDRDGEDDDDDDASYLQGRFNPTEETISQSEIMEIQQDYKEVEMVEDVGSLAQSLGASHLGRSLMLQRQMMSYKASSQAKMMGGQQQQVLHHTNMQQQHGGGVHILGNTPPPHQPTTTFSCGANVATLSSSPGGIGGAMAKAAKDQSIFSQPHVEGLGDSFHRTVPISLPRLDSFKMIKVIGKGSFGKLFFAPSDKIFC